MTWPRDSSRPRSLGHWQALVAAVVLIVSTVLLAEPAKADPPEPSVQIVSLTPAILVDESPVTVRAHLKNVSQEGTTRVAVFMGADSLPSLDAVDAFLDNGGYVWNITEQWLDAEQKNQAATSEGLELELELPFEGLPLWNPDDWGPYAVELRVLTETEGAYSSTLLARTILLWNAHQNLQPLKVSALVPASAAADADPDLLLTVPSVAVQERGEGENTGPATNGNNYLLQLPADSADVSLTAAIGADTLTELALDSLAEHPGAARNTTAAILASEDWFSTSTLRASTVAVIAPKNSLDPLPWTSSKLAVNSENGEVLSEPTGSYNTVLYGWAQLEELILEGFDPDDPNEALNAQQRIRTLTALTARNTVLDRSSLFVNLLDPNDLEGVSWSGAQTQSLEAALVAPWVGTAGLDDVLEGPFNTLDEGQVPAAPRGDTAQMALIFKPLIESVTLAQGLLSSSGADHPLSSLAPVALAPTALGLSDADRESLARTTAAQLAREFDVVSVAPSPTVNVVGTSAELPVTVVNSGSNEVHVWTGIVTDDPRLRGDEWVGTTIPADSSTTANVPISAIGSGNVSITAVVKADDGTILSSSEPLLVRVRPNLGDTVTWSIGAALAVLFLVGLYRTLKQGRRGTQTTTLHTGGSVE